MSGGAGEGDLEPVTELCGGEGSRRVDRGPGRHQVEMVRPLQAEGMDDRGGKNAGAAGKSFLTGQ